MFGIAPKKTICFPSGDQRGMPAYIGKVEVSCSFWVPSTRLRHKMLSDKSRKPTIAHREKS